ncbi:MAG: aldehyde ferredoxin oxidoreductase N-terminal domain-containing protein [Dehalococcoidia bacterium]|nr:aldehyde ferredoxin oxidoreductase N-terminal domain-containing protein [Dehalococcoidia bacterium]
MKISGYAGRILYVDLTTGSVRRQRLSEEAVRGFMGGAGINYWLAAQVIDPKADPFSPGNAVILGAGPFSGTIIPSSAELSATTKFPVNGAIASARGGGAFAAMLKSSGYDHVVITGATTRPIYIRIQDESVTLEDARELWGKDIFQTVTSLLAAHEPCSTISIGQAGENLVRISLAYIDRTGHLGTGGLAAVMGSKNLKAIVACQGSHAVEVAHRVKLQKLVDTLVDRMKAWPGRQQVEEAGITGLNAERWLREPYIGDYWTRSHSPTRDEAPRVRDFVRRHKESRRPIACLSCQIACKERVELKSGPYAGTASYGHVVQPFPGGGDTYDRSVKWVSEMNRYGLCSFDFSAITYLVAHLQRLGILDEKTVGFRVREDDLETVLKLAEMTVRRQGFGDILAEGLLGIGRKFPEAQKHIAHIKGRSPVFQHGRAYDPRVRGLGTMEFTMLTNPRGGHVSTGGSPSYEAARPASDFARHGERMGIPAQAIPGVTRGSGFNVGRFTRYSEDWCSLFDSVGLCNRAFINRFYHVNTITDLYNAVTGLDMKPADLMKAAERSWNLWRLLNVKEGFSRKDDRPPAMWFVPLKEDDKEIPLHDYYGTRRLTPEDVDKFLDEYYDERGWDPRTGAPTPEKLKDLELEKYSD